MGVSIDHSFALDAWARELGGISFPLLSDFEPKGEIARRYGVLRPQGMAERAIVVVDKAGVVRYIDVHVINEHPDEEQIFEALDALR